MNSFFIHKRDLELLPECDRQELIAEVQAAAAAGMWVSPRGEEFDGELRLSQVCTMSPDEAHEYNATGGGWKYIPPPKGGYEEGGHIASTPPPLQPT